MTQMKFTRRKFLRFLPASVGAVTVGTVVLGTASPAKRKVTTEMLVAAQKATDPQSASISPAFVEQYEQQVREVFSRVGSRLLKEPFSG